MKTIETEHHFIELDSIFSSIPYKELYFNLEKKLYIKVNNEIYDMLCQELYNEFGLRIDQLIETKWKNYL